MRCRDLSWLNSRRDLVDNLDASVFLFEVLAFVEADETDDPFHVVWIRICGRRLIDQTRLLDAGLSGDRKHH